MGGVVNVTGGGGGGFDPTAIIGGALSGIGNVVGSAMDAASQRETNEANIASAREQMAFQEKMSSSAYQRAVSDMKSAGLNPALAYSQGGASSPGGSMATSQAVKSGGIATAIGNIPSTAIALKQQAAQTEKIQSDTGLNTGVKAIQEVTKRNLENENRISGAQAAKAEAEAKFYQSDFGRKYAIPLRETLGLGASAANIMTSGASILKLLKPQNAGQGSDLTKDEKSILESYNKGKGYKRRLP